MPQTVEIIEITKKVKPVPLSSHVKETLENHFAQLNGHETAGLHAMLISEVEKPLIEITLNHCGKNQTKASKILGLSRSTLRKKIELYGLS
ncbi:MAG: Fis family transcriptional regulator [Methylococcales symbiont of Hymedesmia sp. n. MRB-2018]|nr:MAG: Fis family transcriptional regulator [Methylococcales symbiont of Hymedesmia sp. n. MRB-2018]KAF3983687.1 MAG: Fis family transcriptional regulator [Methylococcales symbiont of Hymedesmia sp. n. MRB-2018]